MDIIVTRRHDNEKCENINEKPNISGPKPSKAYKNIYSLTNFSCVQCNKNCVILKNSAFVLSV